MNCPFKEGKKCEEKECAFWLTLFRTDTKGESVELGKCAVTWIPFLITELRVSIDRLQIQIKNKDEGGSCHETVN